MIFTMDITASLRETLGEKHKHYNNLLRKTLGDETIKVENINFDKHDQDNFLMIDIASEKKDVQYILNVLKSEDMLYISRALQKCTWLITDDQYSHIVNPKYLHDQLLPEMSTKAGNKLIKAIRHHLKTEKRVEEFYTHEQELKQATKWLPNCSVQFIEENVKKCVKYVDARTFKRLCEKSIKVFEIMVKNNVPPSFYNVTMFLLNDHAEKYLDVLEESYCPTFNAKATSILMKKSPERIIKNFEKYVHYINIPTFAKNMKKEQIKDFLYEQVNKDLSNSNYFFLRRFLSSHKVMHLIKEIPKEERFEFVKNVFINKIHSTENDEVIPLRPEAINMRKLCQVVTLQKYEWYIFAPFDVAFEEIKKMITTETNQDKKYSMLKTLILCTGKNEKDLQTLLQYYVNNHIKDDTTLKKLFISNLIKNSKVYKHNNNTWKTLNEIFKSMDVFMEKEDNVQDCIILIIIHHVLNDEDIPPIVYNKFSFDTLKRFHSKMNDKEKEKIFNFLYNDLLKKLHNQSISTEKELGENKKILENMLSLLIHWKKDLVDFPLILHKIKEMTNIKQKNSWKLDLSTLYNAKKSWRKHLFEESLLLDPSEEVCINALKHDPELLVRYKNEVQILRRDDKTSLRILHAKLRIYWPESLAIDWTNAYQESLHIIEGHKATARGICNLIPQKSLLKIIKKYAPEEPKINWKEIDEITFSLQKNIAKNMHIARPQLDPNAVFWYAKGDYLQYALPSLLAVFYNMNSALSREFIPKLLDAPVSVQKHGIRFAFLKLDTSKLKTIFLNIWNNSNNPTIRAELFTHTFKLLISSQNIAKIEEIGTLLELFIENLNHKDDPKILKLLVSINEIPLSIRANYLIKCYNVFKRLQPHFTSKDINNYNTHMQTLAEHSREVMDSIDEGFVVEIIEDYLNTEFFNTKKNELPYMNRVTPHSGMIKVISAYLLCTNEVETQTRRFQKILVPIIKRVFTNDLNSKESYYKDNFTAILKRLYKDLGEYVIERNMIIPYKMFFEIQEELKSLPMPENYVTITMWKLTTAFTRLLNEKGIDGKWNEITVKLAPNFADICATFLKEDVDTRFSCIYVIFSRVLKQFLNNMPDEAVCIICKGILKDKEFVQAYLAVIAMLPTNMYLEDTLKQKYNEIHKILLEQTSVEVKMHYHNTFKRNIGQ